MASKRLVSSRRRIGIALLPEQAVSAPLKEGLIERVLPDWSGAKNILHLIALSAVFDDE
jgi:DNA-binding transcriptional LysR family regulator